VLRAGSAILWGGMHRKARRSVSFGPTSGMLTQLLAGAHPAARDTAVTRYFPFPLKTPGGGGGWALTASLRARPPSRDGFGGK
jgi:hypothetical protein